MRTTNGILATTDSNSCMFRTTSTGGLRPRSVVKKLDLRQPYTRPVLGLLLSYAFVLGGKGSVQPTASILTKYSQTFGGRRPFIGQDWVMTAYRHGHSRRHDLHAMST